MGELTGEMGTVATFTGSDGCSTSRWRRSSRCCREAGHVGWVNLNTIINDDGVWPLEFTCRFGYPGFAVLEPLAGDRLGRAFSSCWFRRDCSAFPAREGFSACIVLTTPPMPLSRKEVDAPVGLPVMIGDIDPAHLHFGEVGRADRELVTAGLYGWTAVVTGTGETVEEAKAAAYANAATGPRAQYALPARHRRRAHRRRARRIVELGMAEFDTAGADRVADRPIVAGQLGSRLEILRRHIVAEGDPERPRVRRSE